MIENKCADDQELGEVIKKIVWRCINIMLHNFCFKKNDEVAVNRLAKKEVYNFFAKSVW